MALSALYSNKNSTVYSVKAGFLKHFGGSGKWWLVIICIIDAVLIFEIAIQAIKKTWLPSDVDIWQMLEKDNVIKRRLQEAAAGESAGIDSNPVASQGKGKGGGGAAEEEEREIQDLLDRPRIMATQPLVPTTTTGSTDGSSDYELHTRHSRYSTEMVAPREI